MGYSFGEISQRSGAEDLINMKFYSAAGQYNCEDHSHLFNIQASSHDKHIEVIAQSMDETPEVQRLDCAETAKDEIKSAFKKEIKELIK